MPLPHNPRPARRGRAGLSLTQTARKGGLSGRRPRQSLAPYWDFHALSSSSVHESAGSKKKILKKLLTVIVKTFLLPTIDQSIHSKLQPKTIMKKSLLTLGILAAAAVGANAVTIVDFGESNSYVSANVSLVSPSSPAGNFDFSSSNISPASGYSGPTFWGGAIITAGNGTGTAATNWRIFDNDSNTGNFDAIQVQKNSIDTGSRYYMTFIFSSTAGNFTIDNTSSSTFTLNARRNGGSTISSTTGLRWVLQDTANNYYISELNDGTAAQFGSSYASGTTAVSQSSLVTGVSWFNYNPASGILGGIGSAISDQATFFGTTQFKSAGFWYGAGRSTNGNIDMHFADFSLTAVPEPTTWALLAGSLTTLMIFRRRRHV